MENVRELVALTFADMGSALPAFGGALTGAAALALVVGAVLAVLIALEHR